EVRHKNAGGTTLEIFAVNDITPANATDREPRGVFFRIPSMASGDKVTITLYATGGGTVTCDRLYAALFTPPPYMRSAQSVKLGPETGPLPAAFGTLRSGSVSLPNTGRFLEVVSFSASLTTPTNALLRPRYTADL